MLQHIKRLKRWSLASAIGMFIVLLGGALVTKTDSGRGCGDDWPLCNGKFIPAYTIESMIEYSHRAVSGIVGIIIIITFFIVMRYVRERKDIRFYAGSALFFTFLQAFLGFMAVKWEQSPVVMALHFGISLLALASTMLLAFEIRRLHLPAHPSGWGILHAAGKVVTARFRNFAWLVTIYSYVVVYLGAFVRHTDSGGGCVGWPLCNGEIIPTGTGPVVIAFVHRVAAFVLLLLILWMAYTIYRQCAQSDSMRHAGLTSAILIIAQVLSGGFVALTMGTENLYLAASLIHNVIISVLFGYLCYISISAQQKVRS